MRKRSKNKGFTLIEVIIALAILAVALAPLTANFIVSSKMNLKSRKNLNAMNLAQDMMEGMRSYTAAEIIEKLDVGCGDKTNPDGTSGPATLEGTILPAGTSVGACTHAAGTTKYTISQINTASGTYNDYDVEVELIPDTGTYDGKDMAEIASVDPYYNPVYTMSTSNDDQETVIQIMHNNLTAIGATRTKNQLRDDLQREINLEIKSVGTDANPAYSTTVEVVYKIKSGARGAWGVASGSNVDKAEYRNSQSISKALPKDCPTAVYLYYTGYRTSGGNCTPANHDDDVINIINQTGKDITVYLIRAKEKDNTDLIYNTLYKCRVNLTTKNTDGTPMTDKDAPGWIYLVTNVRYNLSMGEEENKRNEDEDGHAIALPDGVTSGYYRDRAHIYYNSTTNKIVETDYQECISDGYQKSDKGLLYKVEMTIREHKADGTGKVMATYDGGTVN